MRACGPHGHARAEGADIVRFVRCRTPHGRHQEAFVTSPTVVGINRTQDGSIAVTRGGATMYSLQKERISRRKHHWGRLGDLPKLYKDRMPWLDGPVDLVVEGWSSDAELDRIDEYHAELRETLQLTPDARIVQVSHHVTHLYSAFHPSPFDVAAGLVVDNQGSAVRHFTDTLPLPDGHRPATCSRSAPSTAASAAAGSSASPSSSGTATGIGRSASAASTRC